MSSALEHFRNDRFAAWNGMELVELRPGYARARMTVGPQHLNSVGVVQGGAMFTLADLAFAGACNAAGKLAVGVTMSISCVQATQSGTLVAEAVEISRSRRISTCTVRVVNDREELVAMFQGTAYIKDAPFPPVAT